MADYTLRKLMAMKKAIIYEGLESNYYRTFLGKDIDDDLKNDMMKSLVRMNWEQTSNLLNQLEERVITSKKAIDEFEKLKQEEEPIIEVVHQRGEEKKIAVKPADELYTYFGAHQPYTNSADYELDVPINDLDRVKDGKYEPLEESEPTLIEAVGEEYWKNASMLYLKYVEHADLDFDDDIVAANKELASESDALTSAVLSGAGGAQEKFKEIVTWYEDEFPKIIEEERQKYTADPEANYALEFMERFSDAQKCETYYPAYKLLLNMKVPNPILTFDNDKNNKNDKDLYRVKLFDVMEQLRLYAGENGDEDVLKKLADENQAMEYYQDFLEEARDAMRDNYMDRGFYDYLLARDVKKWMDKQANYKDVGLPYEELNEEKVEELYYTLASNEIEKKKDEDVIRWYLDYLEDQPKKVNEKEELIDRMMEVVGVEPERVEAEIGKQRTEERESDEVMFQRQDIGSAKQAKTQEDELEFDLEIEEKKENAPELEVIKEEPELEEKEEEEPEPEEKKEEEPEPEEKKEEEPEPEEKKEEPKPEEKKEGFKPEEKKEEEPKPEEKEEEEPEPEEKKEEPKPEEKKEEPEPEEKKEEPKPEEKKEEPKPEIKEEIKFEFEDDEDEPESGENQEEIDPEENQEEDDLDFGDFDPFDISEYGSNDKQNEFDPEENQKEFKPEEKKEEPEIKEEEKEPENNEPIQEQEQPAEKKWHVNLKSYAKALNELKGDLEGTLSIFSRDSDEFKRVMGLMKEVGDFERLRQDQMIHVVNALQIGVEAYQEHTRNKPIDNDRRNNRIAIFEKIGELAGKFKSGVENPKIDDYKTATDMMLQVAYRRIRDVPEEEIEASLMSSPSYKKLMKETSMYKLSKIAKDDKLAAEMLAAISKSDKKLRTQGVAPNKSDDPALPKPGNQNVL